MKNQKGITLVALIITIIVMLILAGVSISLVTGEKGVMTQAEAAKLAQANAEEEERVSLAILNAKTSKLSSNSEIEFNEEFIKEAVEKDFGANSCTVIEEADCYVVTMLKSNNEYKISKLENGNTPIQVSIEGKYGYDKRPDENSYEYYMFDDGIGTGQYLKDHYYGVSNFSYIMDENGNGTITFEDGSTQTFKFEGTENNKVVYIINLWGDNTNVAYTTNWADGLDKINNETYEVYEDGEYIGIMTFNSTTIKFKDVNDVEEITENANYFVKDNYLYMLMSDEDEPNYYFTCYKIEGNKLISLMS